LLCAVACIWLAAVLAASPASAHFPEGPITLVVGASAGGGVDASARLIGGRISDALQQAVLIDNRPGAYSRIASSIVAKAPPDGHMLPAYAPASPGYCAAKWPGGTTSSRRRMSRSSEGKNR